MLTRALLLALAIGACAAAAADPCHGELSLSGEWELSNANGSVVLQAPVPGMALGALRDAGLVGDPLYRFNELETRWVLEDTWTYARTFTLGTDCLSALGEADLHFAVVDTTADVYFNGQYVAHLNTAHRPHRLPVRNLLQPGNNSLVVVLHPSVASAKAAYEAYPYEIPTNLAPGAFEHYNFIRKPASDFGWDWGPAFAPVGLPGDVSLLLYNVPFLRGVHVQQMPGPDTTLLRLECELLAPRGGGRGTLVAALPQLDIQVVQPATLTSAGRQFVFVEVNVSMAQVELWWPHGYGGQPLYMLQVTFYPHNDSAPIGQGGVNGTFLDPSTTDEMDANGAPSCPSDLGSCSLDGLVECCSTSTIRRRVGFRTIELVTDPVPTAYRDLTGQDVPRNESYNLTGESMYFRVNGVPIYIKGANLIPLSIMRTDVTVADWRSLLDAALAAHMNMLRVWGGGLYQADIFYDMCDTAGLLVWSEFLYACAPYPLPKGAVEEAETEASYQVRRLGGHPSIAVWGGNNEIEASLDWFDVTKANPVIYAVDHERLFSQAIGGVLRQLDPHRTYVDTSPSNGNYDNQGRAVMVPPAAAPTKRWGNPQDPRFGDVHFYDYGNDSFLPATYPKAKFVSEFGYQSFPSWHAIRPYSEAADRTPFSEMSRSRQRHPMGDAQLVAQMHRHFRVPASWPDDDPAQQAQNGSDADSADRAPGRAYLQWIYLTQLQQALTYETAFGHWRRGRSDPEALTMGILYWQLNDIWPGYSWSSVNYGGRWKLLHYAVRRAYAPLSLSGVVEHGQLKVYLVNDLQQDVTVNLTIRLVPLSGVANNSTYGKVVASEPTALGARLNSRMVWSGSLRQMRREVPECYGARRLSCVVLLSAECVGPCEVPAAVASLTMDSPSNGSTAWPGLVEAAGAAEIPSAPVWLSEFKHMTLEPPQLQVDGFQLLSESQACFALSSVAPALYVALDTPLAGHFSDNALPVLLPGVPTTVCFIPTPGTNFTMQELQSTLTMTSLYDQQEAKAPCRHGAEYAVLSVDGAPSEMQDPSCFVSTSNGDASDAASAVPDVDEEVSVPVDAGNDDV